MRIVAVLAALAVVLGAGIVAATYYVDSIDELLPDHMSGPQATMIMAADGTTQLAQLATTNRISVPMSVIPEQARFALIAGEDKDFFDDSSRGSVLTRQYVRMAVADQTGSVSDLRQMILARKMEDKYAKLDIMGFYLNAVDFGRGAIGVEKAAQAYFGKGAKELSVAEAAVLGAVIKQPSAYDPQAHPDEARLRWRFVLDSMVDKKWMTAQERAETQFPQIRDSATVSTSPQWGIRVDEGTAGGTATGHVVNYVIGELGAQGIEPEELRTGGYRITTTIDPLAQKLLEQAARPDLKGSQLYGREIVKDATGRTQQDLESAGVVIDHATGRVLAYYGGLDGAATDLAGFSKRGATLIGGHAAGSSMEVYTLAAALDAGASLGSHWKAMPFTTDDKLKIGNGGVPNTGCKDYCTLEHSFTKSYNVPFYWVARQIGAGRVVKTAKQAGVQHMWSADNHELLSSAGRVQDDFDRRPFDRQVGYGQYPITVLDHAAGVATMANGGVANTAHFVQKVERLDPVSGLYKVIADKTEKLASKQAIRRLVADDVSYAMQKTAQDHGWTSAQGGREIAAVPGAWSATVTGNHQNADAWMVGFTKQITVAIWTGNAAGPQPVADPITKKSITADSTPYRIWSGFISGYSTAKNLPKEKLAGPSHVGDDNFGLANGVAPQPQLTPGVGGTSFSLHSARSISSISNRIDQASSAILRARSVLPTPGAPSKNSGRCIVNARYAAAARPSSGRYSWLDSRWARSSGDSTAGQPVVVSVMVCTDGRRAARRTPV